MRTFLLLCCLAILLCGCRGATMALAVANGYLEGRNGAPPPPQVVRVESKPLRCTARTTGIYTSIDCD